MAADMFTTCSYKLLLVVSCRLLILAENEMSHLCDSGLACFGHHYTSQVYVCSQLDRKQNVSITKSNKPKPKGAVA